MHKFFLVCLFLSLLTACLSPSVGWSSPGGRAIKEHPWAGTLRALDLADTTNPAYDITAIYLRQIDNLLQIRVDLLDFQTVNELSLDVKIEGDSTPEGTPFTIHISSEENPARTTLDPLLATVIVELPLSKIPSRPRVDVSTPEENITGLTLDSLFPIQTTPLLLTFYDTFAGRFPAEALRSWDGAHTGPRGERHGLKHLLDAVEKNKTPIVLLDLKEPENLSALEAVGVLQRIRQMQAEDLLILPDQPVGELIFGFSPSQFLWGEAPFRSTLLSRLTFASSDDPNHISRSIFNKATIIPIAIETDSTQPTPDGPSLGVRRALLQTALNSDDRDILVLGGSLQDSTWGSPDMVGAMLAYFASRPYIYILRAEDLMSFPAKLGKPEFRAFPRDTPITKLKTHYRNLTQPVLGFAADWNGSPLSTCDIDLDQDDQPECILANKQYLAILDPKGARLTYLFAMRRINSPLHTQLIGPSWQIAVGLSKTSLWDLSAGEAADPGTYPGAFADTDDLFKTYEPTIEGISAVFTSLDGTRTKAFSLSETGLEVEYRTKEPVITQIPLLIDPETRFTPGWAGKYLQKKTPGGVAWGLENGPMVSVQFGGPITMRMFNESLSLLYGPENPDFNYPPGHYVPFPMAIAEVEMQNGYFLRLERLP